MERYATINPPNARQSSHDWSAKKKEKPCHPSMAGFYQYNLLGVCRANGFFVHATAEVTAGWASHVWKCLRTTVRASHSLHGRRLPISATRMRISTRGLILRQCHNLSSISFERLSLSVLYITASAVQLRNFNVFYTTKQRYFPLCAFSSFSFKPSNAAKRISVTS